jgi:hypothetical protein
MLRMLSSGMLRRVALVLVLTRATWRNIPEDTILHSHRRENLKSYKAMLIVLASPVERQAFGFSVE